MIQFTTLPAPGVLAMPRPPGSPLATTSDFVLALARISGPAVGAPALPGGAEVPVVDTGAGRQALAAGGTILPDAHVAIVPDGPVSADTTVVMLPTAAKPAPSVKVRRSDAEPVTPVSAEPPVDPTTATPPPLDAPKTRKRPRIDDVVAPVAVFDTIAIPAAPIVAPLDVATPCPVGARVSPVTPALPPTAATPTKVAIQPAPVGRAPMIPPLPGAEASRPVPAVADPDSDPDRDAVPAKPSSRVGQAPISIALPDCARRASSPPIAIDAGIARADMTSAVRIEPPLGPTPIAGSTPVVRPVAVSGAPRMARPEIVSQPRSAPSLPQAPPTPGAVARQPAAQAFAAAMFAATRSPITVDRDDPAADLAAGVPLSGFSTAAAPLAVPAAATAQQPALDLARDDWMGSMIDRIESIRDDAGVRETRIRLTPDALGSVDVSIAQDDAGVLHVRFDADSPQARAQLAEAAPRLAEMAEARGLKLGGAGVDSGADRRRQDTQQQSAPAPARPPTAANDDTADSRIA